MLGGVLWRIWCNGFTSRLNFIISQVIDPQHLDELALVLPHLKVPAFPLALFLFNVLKQVPLAETHFRVEQLRLNLDRVKPNKLEQTDTKVLVTLKQFFKILAISLPFGLVIDGGDAGQDFIIEGYTDFALLLDALVQLQQVLLILAQKPFHLAFLCGIAHDPEPVLFVLSDLLIDCDLELELGSDHFFDGNIFLSKLRVLPLIIPHQRPSNFLLF